MKGDLGRGEAEREADILAQAVDGGEAEACHHHPDGAGKGECLREEVMRSGSRTKSAADHNGNRLSCHGCGV